MAITNIPLNDLPTFGRRLMGLAIDEKKEKGKDCTTPTLMAHALYDFCYDLVKPATRRNKKGQRVKDEQHDIDAIKRMVQRHFTDTENATDVPSNYLLAYSKLFSCSLDYLYGATDIKSRDLSVRDMCDKLHLSEKAVSNLMANSEIYLDGFLYQHFEYEFLYSNIDVESSVQVTEFWNDILENDLFFQLPKDWVEMACAFQLYKATQEQHEACNAKKTVLPTREAFIERVDEYYATHHYDPCMGDNPCEIYDHDKDRAMMIMRDIDNEEWSESVSDSTKAKTVYWGCAGMFDRQVANYFHKRAETFEIPTFDPYKEDEGE